MKKSKLDIALIICLSISVICNIILLVLKIMGVQ